MVHTIVVPLDASPFGERALPYALSLARRAGAALELVHVRRPTVPADLESLTPYRFEGIEAYEPFYEAEERAAEGH
jgi:nucleotide-binding universal stress UspA family protein